MPEVGLFLWDINADAPVMNEVSYAFVPRIGDFLDLPDPAGKAAVYRVFAVVVAHADSELAADVHVEQISDRGIASGAYVADLRKKTKSTGILEFYEEAVKKNP